MPTMRNFCTLFDSNYLARALVLYRSLERTGEGFTLFAVCFDDLAYHVLGKLNLSNLVPVPLHAFESPQLQKVKEQRTSAEYCWTCTPHVIRYVLVTYCLSDVTYLDADLCFYGKPSDALDLFDKSAASVLITPHRYTPRYDQSATSGIYCVQFVTFKSDEYGLEVLQWWQDRCLEWCYNRFEDGKFGDQKYLDDWPQRFPGIYVLEHIGGGVAPWNVQQYNLTWNSDGYYVDGFPLIFYHFHQYKNYFLDHLSETSLYEIDRKVINLLYRPYGSALLDAYAEIGSVHPDFNVGLVPIGDLKGEQRPSIL